MKMKLQPMRIMKIVCYLKIYIHKEAKDKISLIKKQERIISTNKSLLKHLIA